MKCSREFDIRVISHGLLAPFQEFQVLGRPRLPQRRNCRT
jgi:hypothetical protein